MQHITITSRRTFLMGASGSSVFGETIGAKAKAVATYNAAADHFDDEPLSFWERYGRRTVNRLALPQGAKVLDVGCGTGASAIPAAERVGPSGGQVLGVDLAEELLKLGRAKAARQGLDSIEFRVGDMEKLGFPDGHFDAVICVFAIFFAKDMEKQVAELWRMVRPGGQLAITTWGQRIFEPASTFWWDSVRRERPDLHSAYTPWDRISEPASLHRLLLDAGASDPVVMAEEGRQVLRSPEDWWTIVLGSGYRWTVDQMGLSAMARLRERNIEWVREQGVTSVETNVIYAVATRETKEETLLS